MADREGLQKIIHGLLLMASTGYPAKVATANAERLATLTGRVVGPYTLSSAKLGIVVQGTQTDVAVTTGSTSDVAGEINTASIGVTASADSKDRLKLVSDAAPVVGGEASAVEILAPATGTDASGTLGFHPGQIDRRPAIVSPDPAQFSYGEQRQVTDIPSWRVTRAAFVSTENIREGIDEIAIVLECLAYDEGGTSASTVELVDRHIRIMQEVLEADRTIEGLVHYLEVQTIDTIPQVMRVRLEPDSFLYFGKSTLTVRVRVRNL